MLAETKHNLTHLLDFSGRDARQTFWFYVLFLFLVYMALGMVGSFVLIGSLMGPVIEAANAGASEQEMQARMGAWMGDMMASILWASLAVNFVMDLLLATAFVRRLHDSDSSGWWAVVVLAAQVASIAAMIPMIDMMQEFMAEAMDPANMANPAYMPSMIGRQSQVALYGLAGWISPIVVIVFGVMPSTEGPNRFGEAPAPLTVTGPSPSPPDRHQG